MIKARDRDERRTDAEDQGFAVRAGRVCKSCQRWQSDKEQRDLRDRLASMAMNGLLANQKHAHRDTKDLARYAYEIADEMIQARGP
jgi:hypothetical protein